MRLHTMLHTILLTCFVLSLNATPVYKVKVGAFAKKIPFTHFAFAGINNVHLDTDQSNIHHYYLRATFQEYQKARIARDTLIRRGFQNAEVIQLEHQAIDGYATISKPEVCHDRIVYFGFDAYDISFRARHQLDTLAQLLNTQPSLKLVIIGYTDSKGEAGYNVALSKNRVRSVKRYLINRGIHHDQIIAKACGEANPVCSNTCPKGMDLPENRKLNRRVLLLTLNQHGELIRHQNIMARTVHPVLERTVLKN